MLFSDDFLEGLAADPIAGSCEICEITLQSMERGTDWTSKDWNNLVEGFSLLSEMQLAGLLPVSYNFPSIPVDAPISAKCKAAQNAIVKVRELLTVLVEEGRIEQLKKRFRNSLGSEFRYEFSQGDLEKVQVLLNELRTEVAASQKLEEGHKARLLKRLEALQAELHKKISDLDKFWGLVGDASVVMAKIGTNAKPIVDRVREVADIVWRTQTRAEELPSGTTLPQIGRAPGEGPPSV